MLVSAPISLALLTVGVLAIVQGLDTASSVGAVVFLGLGTASAWSCAYSLWSICRVAEIEGRWSIEHRLGRWHRTRSITPAEIACVERDRIPNVDVPLPGAGGDYVRVELQSGKRVRIARGLHASADQLARLEAMLTPREARPASTP